VGTITYEIQSTQIPWTDPVSNNPITVQLAIQALYGHIDTIFGSPSFTGGVIPVSKVEVPGLQPNQSIPQGLDYYLTNGMLENLSSCIEGLKNVENMTFT
jgi:hypothetical protein